MNLEMKDRLGQENTWIDNGWKKFQIDKNIETYELLNEHQGQTQKGMNWKEMLNS